MSLAAVKNFGREVYSIYTNLEIPTILSIPYTIGPSQLLAIPAIIVSISNIAYYRFKNCLINVTEASLSADEKYIRQIAKFEVHNEMVGWIGTLVFSILAIVPILGGPPGVYFYYKIQREYCFFSQRITIRAEELKLDKAAFSQRFNVNMSQIQSDTDYQNYLKHSFCIKEHWPEIDIKNVSENLHTSYHARNH